MGAPVFLGDEVAAAGWRLAGVDARVPRAGAEGAVLAAALAQAPLVIVSAGIAARMPEPALRAALRGLAPLTVIVPDLRGTAPYPDIAARMKHQLGIEA